MTSSDPVLELAIRRFEGEYAARSGVTVEWLHEHGRWGAPCDCGEEGCEGFQMLHAPRDDMDRELLARQGLLRYVGGEGEDA